MPIKTLFGGFFPELTSNRRNEAYAPCFPAVNCVGISVGAVVLDSFGKRKVVTWMLAVCCYWAVILICKMAAGLHGGKLLHSCGASSFLFPACAVVIVCRSVCVHV